jgi:PleD family two-component response regulator
MGCPQQEAVDGVTGLANRRYYTLDFYPKQISIVDSVLTQ